MLTSRLVDFERTGRMLTSKLVSQEDFEGDWLKNCCALIGVDSTQHHRKYWEWSFIIQALAERRKLYYTRSIGKPRGLGFGVGCEPLSSLFLAAGCDITATDMPSDLDTKAHWTGTGQHSSEAVPVDMNFIPIEYFRQFDFVWSSGTFEHLGSLQAGKQFYHYMKACLKPGGVAVHTTEYNLTSEEETYLEGPVCPFRKKDLIEMCPDVDLTVRDLGTLAVTEDDKREPHLQLQLGAYAITSVGLIYEAR